MSTIHDLTAYLGRLPFVNRDLFEATQVDESEIVPSMTCVDVSNGIYLLYREVYTAVFYFEAWVHPKQLILSHIIAWLLEYGGDRNEGDLGFPVCESLKNDDNSFDLMITLRFQDCVYAMPDPDGDLQIRGQRWKRCLSSIEIAENFEFY